MSKNTKKSWDIIIIGAGASGMMAGIIAGRAGKKVLILEQLDKPGKKILATGNGKCNFTNSYMSSECFNGDSAFRETVMEQFTTRDCIDFFHSIGIYPKEKNGYYYPNSEQASSVVTAMTEELKRFSVEIKLQTKAEKILPSKDGFCICAGENRFYAHKLIVATGLLAAPKLGGNGSLFPAIKELGHRFRPIVPSLCGFYCSGMPFKKIAGVRAQGNVSVVVDGTTVACDRGEIQFTEYGLSGIPIFQISRHVSMGLYEKRSVEIFLSVLPDMTQEEIKKELLYRKEKNTSLDLFLNGLLNKKLSDAFWEMLSLNPHMKTLELTEKDLLRILNLLNGFSVKVNKYRDYEFAQICAGGIPATEIHADRFESVIIDNLYFCGEILNLDGICGGYNLHFAWGSGFIAANAALK